MPTIIIDNTPYAIHSTPGHGGWSGPQMIAIGQNPYGPQGGQCGKAVKAKMTQLPSRKSKLREAVDKAIEMASQEYDTTGIPQSVSWEYGGRPSSVCVEPLMPRS